MKELIHVKKKEEALIILGDIRSFEFAFCVHIMTNIFGITFELWQGSKKEQAILKAMTICKQF